MRVKKFRARTAAEAAEQVKREWGPDALILQARRVRAFRWWSFWRPVWMVEVTAALAEAPPGRPHAPAVMSRPDAADPPAPPDPPAALRACPDPAASPADGGPAPAPGGDTPAGPGDLEADVKQMKELVGHIWRQVRSAQEQAAAGPAPALPLYPETLDPIYRALLEREVEPALARCLTDLLLERAAGKGTGLLRQEAAAAIERLLGPARPIETGTGGRVVAFVGPTGVGKTTTLAKLAAHFALRERRRVCLVTLDTFRVGAVDQLRTYAQISGLPCLVAATPEEFASLLERAPEYDLVLVDTAGRSHHDEMRMTELEGFLSARRPDEVHLVISATSRYSDALEVLDRYRGPGFDKLLFTKLDETRHHGLILNVAVVAQRPLSYVTTGQQVPEDIAVARPGDLAKLLV